MTWSSATVVEISRPGPRLRRVALRLRDPQRVVLPGRGDEAYGIYFPDAGERAAPPMELRDGVWGYYDEQATRHGRNYSIRHRDDATSTVLVDFVLHDKGVATEWVRRAAIGDEVVVSYPRAWYQPDEAADWQLLVADLAGLPALARIVEELGADVPATVIVEVADEADLAYLPRRDNVRVRASLGTGNGLAPSALAGLVAAEKSPAGRGYCWFGGEAAQSREIRKHLRRELGFERTQYDIVGYWRFDSETWDERFEAAGAEELIAVYQDALAAGLGLKIAGERYDDALERAGL